MKHRSSLINWKETHEIFNDNLYPITGEISDNNYYYDSDDEKNTEEINEGIKRDYLDDVFEKIKNFKPERFGYFVSKNVDTTMGNKDILTKQWKNGTAGIQLMIFLNEEKSENDDEIYDPDENCGYAVIYGDSSTFLISGSDGRDHFVYHPSFTFNSIKGLNYQDPSNFIFELDDVKRFFKWSTLDLIFKRYR